MRKSTTSWAYAGFRFPISFLEKPKSARLCFMSCVIYASRNGDKNHHKRHFRCLLLLLPVNHMVPHILELVLRLCIGTDGGNVELAVFPQARLVGGRRRLHMTATQTWKTWKTSDSAEEKDPQKSPRKDVRLYTIFCPFTHNLRNEPVQRNMVQVLLCDCLQHPETSPTNTPK